MFVRMSRRGFQRREIILRFYQNGALWGLGNGLVSTSLITYLAGVYNAKGLALSLILAAPYLVGVLRLGTPLWIERVGNRKYLAICAFLLSTLFLVLLACLTPSGVLPNPALSLVSLVLLWTIYHVLEYVGVVALWAWIGNIVPGRVRGRFIGRREALLNAFQVAAMIVSGWGNLRWKEYCNEIGTPEHIWYGYSVSAALGALLMSAAVWPLFQADDRNVRNLRATNSPSIGLREILAPFCDRNFRRFLVYGIWFSFSNGIANLPILIYRMYVLKISYGLHLLLDGTSQGVQSLIMPGCGRALDRWGGVPVLTVCQILVALALVFYLLASPSHWWWVIGAYVLWVAYAGINTAMPKLMLSFSTPEHHAAYSAAWFATLHMAYGITIILGGLLFDFSKDVAAKMFPPEWQMDHFKVIFALGLILRISAAFWAARIREPRYSGSQYS